MAQDKTVVFDSEFAMTQLSENKELLVKMLDRFTSDYANISAELEPAIAASDFETCKAKSHTIKGVAGNLGFWNLYHYSKILEDGAKEQSPDLVAALSDFKSSLENSFQAIAQFKSGGEQKTTEEAAPAAGDPRAELTDLLNAFEFIAPDKLEQLLSAMGLDDGVKSQISQAINDLDYPGAIELINNN